MQYFHWKKLRNLTKNQRYALLALFVFLVCTVGLIQHKAVVNQLRDWKVLPQQERLTELYFFDHLRLPTTYKVDQPQDVAFTIRNSEGKDLSYSYRIAAVPEGDSSPAILKEGSLKLEDNSARTVQESVVTPDFGKRVRIEISINNNQSISYWVERTPQE